jgi:hypothetical protein
VAIGNCEGPVAGPLINLFARGNSQIAAELNKKKGGDPRAIGASFQRSFGSCVATITTLVARPSVHRGEARAGVALLSRRKEVLNRGSYSVVEALASLGSDFVLDENLLPWIRKADLHFSSLRR